MLVILLIADLTMAPVCTDPRVPSLRQAVVRYCDHLPRHPFSSEECLYEPEPCLEEWAFRECELVARRIVGCGVSIFLEGGELHVHVGDICDGYSIRFAPRGRGWRVISLQSSAEDPC